MENVYSNVIRTYTMATTRSDVMTVSVKGQYSIVCVCVFREGGGGEIVVKNRAQNGNWLVGSREANKIRPIVIEEIDFKFKIILYTRLASRINFHEAVLFLK